jgi:hypothetical protein
MPCLKEGYHNYFFRLSFLVCILANCDHPYFGKIIHRKVYEIKIIPPKFLEYSISPSEA